MNGYTLTRNRYNFKFDNPDKVRAIHSDLYFFIVDRRNRFGQKEKFGLPTQMTMELLGIGSYNTYQKTYNDLIKWGFIKEVQKSKNQHSSRIVALSFFDKATDEALDKALDETGDESPDDIIEQLNKRTKEQKNISSKEEQSSPLSEYDPKEITNKINHLVNMIKDKCDELGVAYNKDMEKQFARHILTAKEYGSFCEKIGMSREDFAVAVLQASVQIKYWKGPRAGPRAIYKDYAEVYNQAKSHIQKKQVVDLSMYNKPNDGDQSVQKKDSH